MKRKSEDVFRDRLPLAEVVLSNTLSTALNLMVHSHGQLDKISSLPENGQSDLKKKKKKIIIIKVLHLL